MNTSIASTSFLTSTSAMDQSYSSVIVDSLHHRLTSYGSMLPVLIVEAITSENNDSLTVSIKGNGYSCLISGRSLYVWRFRSSGPSWSGKGMGSSACYELELPPSDLAFKADLISLFVEEETSTAQPPIGAVVGPSSSPVSLMAVSPEGIVRYWSNIAYESSFVESYVGDLQGQECAVLLQLSQREALLATTTNTLVLITILHSSELSFRTLRIPQGVLSGLSKRLHSFFSGGITSAEDTSGKPSSLVALFKETPSTVELANHLIYAVSGSSVQKWSVSGGSGGGQWPNGGESLLHEQDLEGVLRHSFLRLLPPSTDPSTTKVIVIDASLVKPRTLEVFSALVPDVKEGQHGSPTQNIGYFYIASATFVYRGDSQGFHLEAFNQIVDPSNLLPRSRSPSDLKLLSCPDRATTYLYDESRIYFIRGHTIVDWIDFEGREDGILGAGVCEKTPILFTVKDGLVAISPTVIDLPADHSLSSSAHESLGSIGGSSDTTHLGIFKKSFYLFSRGEVKEAENLLSSHFDLSQPLGQQQLATVILDFCIAVVDGDMNQEIRLDRGKTRSATRTGSPKSLNLTSHDLLITTNLDDKVATLSVVLEMVDQIPVTLSSLLVKSTPLALSIYDLLERVLVTWSVKTTFPSFSHLLQAILDSVCQGRRSSTWTSNRNTPSTSHPLYPLDDFYREPSRVEDVFPAILRFQEESSNSPHLDEDEVLQLILSASDLLISLLTEVTTRRGRPPEIISRLSGKVDKYSPWDSNPSDHGVRRCLARQLTILKDRGARLAATSDYNRAQNRDIIWEKFYQLLSILLASHWSHLKTMKKGLPPHHSQEKWFEEDRGIFLKDLVSAGIYDRALLLAETYLDFDSIIEICEATGSEEKLEKYRSIFASYDFSSYLTNYYIKKGKAGKILRMPPHQFGTTGAIGNDLLWIQQIQLGEYGAAASTLKQVALREVDLSRKKTILSLSKLSSVASGETTTEVDNLLYDIHIRMMEKERERKISGTTQGQ